jgi:hypothetical protein
MLECALRKQGRAKMVIFSPDKMNAFEKTFQHDHICPMMMWNKRFGCHLVTTKEGKYIFIH